MRSLGQDNHRADGHFSTAATMMMTARRAHIHFTKVELTDSLKQPPRVGDPYRVQSSPLISRQFPSVVELETIQNRQHQQQQVPMPISVERTQFSKDGNLLIVIDPKDQSQHKAGYAYGSNEGYTESRLGPEFLLSGEETIAASQLRSRQHIRTNIQVIMDSSDRMGSEPKILKSDGILSLDQGTSSSHHRLSTNPAYGDQGVLDPPGPDSPGDRRHFLSKSGSAPARRRISRDQSISISDEQALSPMPKPSLLMRSPPHLAHGFKLPSIKSRREILECVEVPIVIRPLAAISRRLISKFLPEDGVIVAGRSKKHMGDSADLMEHKRTRRMTRSFSKDYDLNQGSCSSDRTKLMDYHALDDEATTQSFRNVPPLPNLAARRLDNGDDEEDKRPNFFRSDPTQQSGLVSAPDMVVDSNNESEPHVGRLKALWLQGGIMWPLQSAREARVSARSYSLSFVFGTAMPLPNKSE
jgi:hypothetical protein